MRGLGIIAAMLLSGPELSVVPSWTFGTVPQTTAPSPSWNFATPAPAAPQTIPATWQFDTADVPAVPIALTAWSFDTAAKPCGPECKCQGKDCGTGCVCCGKAIAKSCPDCTADDYTAAIAKAKREGKQVYLFVGDESERVKAACEYAKANGMVFAYESRPVKLTDGVTYMPGVYPFGTKDEHLPAIKTEAVTVGAPWIQAPVFSGFGGSSCPNGQCGRRN